MKKIKTIKVVGAYNFLKRLKVKELSDEVCVNIWKDIKAFRATAETYEKDTKDIDESLKGDDSEKWNERIQKAVDLENKVKAGDAEYTSDDIKEQKAVSSYLTELTDKKNKLVNELNDAEVEVDIKPIKEADFIKAIKLNDQSIGVMDELDFMIEE